MKNRSIIVGRFALSAVAVAAMWVASGPAMALGLGRVQVQSALGEVMRAEIDVTSLTPEEASSLRVRIAPPESYRAAGVDYSAVLQGTQATLQRRPDGRSVLRVTSDRAVQEPFVDVILEITWSTGRLVREYTLLFDPPRLQAAPPTVAAAPSMSTAPSTNGAARPAPAPAQAAAPRASAPVSAAPAPAPAPVARATPPATSAPAPQAGADEVRVRSGDTLSKIAGRVQQPGVSLDQMLVSLYRGNPQAFVGNNMNRLRSGVVLSVPSAETARETSTAEARQIIQAQSADFGAYRQRLAAAVPGTATEAPARQATGQVQAEVQDRKQAGATTPDKLTLSQGGVRASAPEARVSRETEKKDTSTRVAELSRNVEDLRKLQAGSGASAPGVAAPTARTPAGPTVPVPAPVVPPTTAVAPASAPVAAAPTPAAPASPPQSTITAAAPAASPPATTTPAPSPASAPAARASAPRVAPPVVEEPGLLGSLMDSPYVLPVAGLLVALLAGLGFYRLRNKGKKDSGETSFLESRLQPDSFFGASGGQRIDTRDASGVSSSMSYSLSQLDAIGDVDPVAEADVYLAYGRDLQAEEILKEAMRGNPDRLAIRTKLLEVYSKRRDTKGFELLASQLFTLTNGEGEDWAKAQELGRSIDPENPLYQPGGAPPNVTPGPSGQPVEPLGASTMPQSVLPTASTFGAADTAAAPTAVTQSGGLDLDLDLDAPVIEAPAPTAPESTQPLPTTPAGADDALDFDLPTLDTTSARAAPAPTPAAEPMAFDLGDLSLDLNAPPQDPFAAPAPAPAGAPEEHFAGLEMPDVATIDGAPEGDPLVRKLELAEEFRQIGDTEGARDLLEEVIAKASGSLKSKAQGMLDSLV